MKIWACVLIIILSPLLAGAAQKRGAKRPPAKTPPREAPKQAARILGTPVTIITRNGDRISGTLLDLSAYSIRFRADNLESVLALDTLASISFGSSVDPQLNASQSERALPPDFARDAQDVLKSFQSMSTSTAAGIDYSDYGQKLTDLRRDAEKFMQKYSRADNTTASRFVALIGGALTDYTWARTVWVLKFGRSNNGTVAESDSPTVADLLILYPDLRQSAASDTRYSADKIIAGLWKYATDKVNQARTLLRS